MQFEATVPTVLDRFIQQAVLQVLQRRWDRTFSRHSFGFRPGRSAHQAVAQAQHYIADGYGWVVDLDLEKFFDRVNHDKLMGRIAQRVEDKRLLKLIRAFLTAGMMEDGLVGRSGEGTPQGGPLVAAALRTSCSTNSIESWSDGDSGSCGMRTTATSTSAAERAGHRVMDGVTRFITTRLKLKVNASKSAVARPQERKFLGFSFTAVRRSQAADRAEGPGAVQGQGPGTDATGAKASAWRRRSRNWLRTCSAGAATSASVKRPRCW